MMRLATLLILMPLMIMGLVIMGLVSPAHADEIRPASIDFIEIDDGKWQLQWKQPLSAPGPADLNLPQLPPNCQYAAPPSAGRAGMAIIAHAQVSCDGPVAGGAMGLPQLIGNADALLRVAPKDQPVQSHHLTAAEPLAIIEAQPGRWQVLRLYLIIGAQHILMGWDHLLFVVALVLLVVKGWPVVKAATAFTIAHSITLIATTLGYTGLPQRPVEILIALSIVFLAVELMRADRGGWTRRWPWIVAFGFGLLHGFGFAGALREIGLPAGEVPMALLAFNLGVELGQLLVIALVMALRGMLRRFAPPAEAPLLRMATYGIGITASYWLVDRLVG